jgi:hypothetical protein
MTTQKLSIGDPVIVLDYKKVNYQIEIVDTKLKIVNIIPLQGISADNEYLVLSDGRNFIREHLLKY